MITDTESAYKFIGWKFEPVRKRRKLNIENINDPDQTTNTNNKQM